ncbi:MAG: TonB-dependent receptor [Lewinellaceae bacterium]|nr:TonB-dependent receptor [Lewinellaceae bacterium]
MKLFFSFFFTLVATALAAHNGSIRGSVLDAATKNPLAGVSVSIDGANLQVYTDELGHYRFGELSPGTYTLVTSYMGYEVNTKMVTVREAETTTVFHYLNRTDIELSAVEISSNPDVQVQVIPAIDARMRPTNTSQDILRMVPGLFIAQHAGGGKAEQIFLRGFDIDHGTDVAIDVDGIPVNMVSHAHGQGYADLHFLIPETVDRIQFGKGPYYAPYGDLATAGYIGFQTKNAIDRNMVKLEAGQFDTYRAVGMFNLLNRAESNRPGNAYLATEYFYSNGYFDSPQAYDRFSAFAKYNGVVGEKGLLSASLSSFTSRWDASGQIPERAVKSGQTGFFGSIDDTEGGRTSRTNLNVRISAFPGQNSVFRNQFYLSLYDFELFSNFTFFLNDPFQGDQIKQKEKRRLLGYRGSFTRNDRWAGLDWKTEAGLLVRYDATQNSELTHTAGRTEVLERKALGDINQINAGIFLNETVHVAPWLTLNAGLRFDQFQFMYVDKLQPVYARRIEAAHVFSPKLSAYFTPNDRIQLFVNTGYGFHSNDTRVVVTRGGEQILPKALGAETGAIWKATPRILISTSLWRLDLEQEFVYVGDEAVVEPGGKTRRSGVDISGRLQLFDWLFADLDANYTYARATDAPKEEAYIPLAPEWTSIGGLSFQMKSGLNGSLRYRHLGNRAANEDNTVVAEGYWLADALLNFTNPGFEIGLSVENLLDRRWKEAQFDTESRLFDEPGPVSEIHFTPGTPFNMRMHVSVFF